MINTIVENESGVEEVKLENNNNNENNPQERLVAFQLIPAVRANPCRSLGKSSQRQNQVQSYQGRVYYTCP